MPEEIEIMFKKEGYLGEHVNVKSQINGIQTLHSIKSTDDDRELSRIRIKWKER